MHPIVIYELVKTRMELLGAMDGIVSIQNVPARLLSARCRRSARCQGRDRIGDLPLFRSREHRIPRLGKSVTVLRGLP
jgi:hypothetical protein